MSSLHLPDSIVSRIIVPDSPRALDLDKEEWREYQKEAVEEVLAALDEDAHVLLDAPTGTGKTVIGAAVARCLGGSALYLAHTIQLQLQQLGTLPDAVTCTGRSNHACLEPTGAALGLTAADADCPCVLAAPGGCGYYDQWFRAIDARDVVLNYAFVVRTIKGRGVLMRPSEEDMEAAIAYGVPPKPSFINPFRNRTLMVCDEGHNLESALLDADGVDFYQRTWEEFGYDLPRTTDYPVWLEFIKWALPRLEQDVEDAGTARRAAGSSRELWNKERKLKSMLQAAEQMPRTTDHTPVHVGRAPYGYRVRPLWAWNRSNDILFKHSPNVMIMSATLGEPELAARVLGLQNWKHVKIPSTFPVGNRPVFYWPVSKMKHGMDDFDKQKQIAALIHLARKFPDSPGVVHANSFVLARYLADGVARMGCPDVSARILLHDSSDAKGSTFVPFEKHEGLDNAILITPSATTGVDWDFVGWQMIPKVPFPDLSDEFTRLRYDYVTDDGYAVGKEVYQQEAVKTLVQAAGRNVRTPVSKGVTVVTDAAFWPLFKYTAPKAFPEWFRAAVRWYEPKGAA